MQNENTIKTRKQQGSHSKSKINQIKMWLKAVLKSLGQQKGLLHRMKLINVRAGQVASGKESHKMLHYRILKYWHIKIICATQSMDLQQVKILPKSNRIYQLVNIVAQLFFMFSVFQSMLYTCCLDENEYRTPCS